MKKRVLGFVFVFLMFAFALNGCGKSSDIQQSSGNFGKASNEVVVTAPEESDTPSLMPDNTPSVSAPVITVPETISVPPARPATFRFSDIPTYSGIAYVVINSNNPYFTEDELTTNEFEAYSILDTLGRCGVAFANVSPASMPTEPRGSIGQIKPSGWHTVKYDWVDGKYLYNRCHLIGYQLTAENANEQNLITGTRYLNIEGMLPFENMVADYVKETGNHVAYRVTPIFEENNLLAVGVLMEGYSVEDQGDGICFCIFGYNVQPGVAINYATGDSQPDGSIAPNETPSQTPIPAPSPSQEPASVVSVQPVTVNYIANTNTKKFHYPSCSGVNQMSESNKWYYSGTANELVQMGYIPCKKCKP